MSSLSKSVEAPAEVALTGVSRRFDETFSLQDLELSVADGESVVLIGPSASGKTVTLKTIAGLFRPDTGSILIRGQETIGIGDKERSENRPDRGTVPALGPVRQHDGVGEYNLPASAAHEAQ